MNVLVAVDHSEVSARTVDFVGQTLGHRTPNPARITLLHVVESLPEYIVSRAGDGTAGAVRQVADEWTAHNRAQGEALLTKFKGRLEAAGIPSTSIRTKLVSKDAVPEARRVVAALCIIDELRSEPYQVVALGRRGTSATIESFIGSVAEKVLREARGKTVWIVD